MKFTLSLGLTDNEFGFETAKIPFSEFTPAVKEKILGDVERMLKVLVLEQERGNLNEEEEAQFGENP